MDKQALMEDILAAAVAVNEGKLEELDLALVRLIRAKPVENFAFSVWHTDDVIQMVDRLDRVQAQEVLRHADQADGGINRDLFDAFANQLFPEPNLVDYFVTLDNELQLHITVPEESHPDDYVDFHGHVTDSTYGGLNNGTGDYTLPEDKHKLQKFLCERHNVNRLAAFKKFKVNLRRGDHPEYVEEHVVAVGNVAPFADQLTAAEEVTCARISYYVTDTNFKVGDTICGNEIVSFEPLIEVADRVQ